ncbi:MAG: double-stranded uracil-DNA glycosylase [Frankiales bacterium]|nr:double-stranded uracil-DNA glycosylase [Frankiales bacterium]
MTRRPAHTTPRREELLAAYGRTVPDLVGADMSVLLVGINPSLWSGHAGYHFARPANRLWRTLHEAGFTDRVLHPSETTELRAAGIGITNFVRRATARADEVDPDEIRAGVARLRRVVRTWRPPVVAFLGVTAYRIAFNAPKAAVGPQDELFEGSRVWLLPNPSGLNAHYQQPQLNEAYGEMRAALGEG